MSKDESGKPANQKETKHDSSMDRKDVKGSGNKPADSNKPMDRKDSKHDSSHDRKNNAPGAGTDKKNPSPQQPRSGFGKAN
ncbi:MAG: hypothetical protein ACYCTV_02075 [Leptospirales bacterium]